MDNKQQQEIKVHTLNARDNIYLSVLGDMLEVQPFQLNQVVKLELKRLTDTLALSGIEYENLRAALSPQTTKYEYVFLFNFLMFEENYGYRYGKDFLNALMTLGKEFNCSILSGDVLPHVQRSARIIAELDEISDECAEAKFSLYAIYINNLSHKSAQKIEAELKKTSGYVGSKLMNSRSLLKSFLSATISQTYLKFGAHLISAETEDETSSGNTNEPGWEHENYTHISVPEVLFHLFLSYKIERPILEDDQDLEHAISLMNGRRQDMTEVALDVDERKLQYLKTQKSDSMYRARLENISRESLSTLIQNRISLNYLYNIRVNQYGSFFNIIIELPGRDGRDVRLMVGLKYVENESSVNLTTMY